MKGGVIIRLIDIVLLLLFGFLVISEINRKSPIKLPQSMVPVKKEIDLEEIFIIGVQGDNRFYIENEDRHINDLNSVTNLILQKRDYFKKFGKDLRVRVRSNWNLPIKHTMRIAKFCQKEGIPTGMDVHSVKRGKNE